MVDPEGEAFANDRLWQIHQLEPVLVEDEKPELDNPAAVASSRITWRRLPRAPWGRRLLLGLVIIAVTLLFSYVAFSGINLSEAWHALRTTDYWWLPAALVAFGFGALARALRWRSLFAREAAPGRRSHQRDDGRLLLQQHLAGACS